MKLLMKKENIIRKVCSNKSVTSINSILINLNKINIFIDDDKINFYMRLE